MLSAGVTFSACNGNGIGVEGLNKTSENVEEVVQEPTQEEPVMKFVKTRHDFGKMTQGESVKETFKFTNTGSEPLIISSHAVQCGCTTPEYSKEPIMPGESSEVVVGFNSRGKSGTQNKTVTLKTNQGDFKLSFTVFVEMPKADNE